MSMTSNEEFSSRNLLKLMRDSALIEDFPAAVSHELKVRLGVTVCEDAFTGDEPPATADIMVQLRKLKLTQLLTPEHVLAGWYMMHLDDNDPSYDVLSRFDFSQRDWIDEGELVPVIRTFVADMEALLRDIEHDPELTDDFYHTEQYVLLARQITPEDVLDTLRVCRRFGIPPLTLTR